MIGVPAKGSSPQPRFSRRSPQHDLAESGQLLPYVGSEWSPKTGRSPASWTMPYGQAAQNEFFGSFRNAISSAVESRFSTALRCGNRPN